MLFPYCCLAKQKRGRGFSRQPGKFSLKFFARRIVSGQRYGDDDADLLDVVWYKYPRAYDCAKRVCAWVEREKGFRAGKNEMLYLTIHIARVMEKNGD